MIQIGVFEVKFDGFRAAADTVRSILLSLSLLNSVRWCGFLEAQST